MERKQKWRIVQVSTLFVVLLSALVCALVGRPNYAVLILAATTGTMALLRSIFRGQVWFAARVWYQDVVINVALCAGLVLLYPWSLP